MFARRWIFAGAFAVAMTAVSFIDATPGVAAGKGANLICKANGKVFKAIPRTIQGTYSKLSGNFILSSSKVSLNLRRRTVSIKNITLTGYQTGLADEAATFPVNLSPTVSTFINVSNLTLGSTPDDAPTWVGADSEMTITVKSWKNGKKRVRQDGKFVLVDVAKVRIGFSGSLPPGDNNVGAPNMNLTNGFGQATIFVSE